MGSKINQKEITHSLIRAEIKEVTRIMAMKGKHMDVTSFELPDLLFPRMYLTEEQYQERQNQELKKMIEGRFHFMKDGRIIHIKVIPEMLRFISDLFFGRVNFAILWKPRGGGGSLATAIVIWLTMVFKKRAWLDMAGSGEQAKIVYEYTKSFWDCFEKLKVGLLRTDPTMSKTELVNGADLKCIACSDKQARGKHKSGFAGDESNQKDEASGEVYETAMQGMFSEPDPMAVLASTFHHPFGFFKDYWDEAESKGFEQYKWDIFDTMKTCRLGMETATKEDPKALNFCRTRCPLTEKQEIKDDDGNVLETVYSECNGRARDTDGWTTFDNVLRAKKMNASGLVWKVEFCCKRPKVRGQVYTGSNVDDAEVNEIEMLDGGEKVVGLDWGLYSQAVAVMVAEAPDGLCSPEAKLFEGDSAVDIGKFLMKWQKSYGPFVVYADAEETYGNQQLELQGLKVVPVHFGKWKQFGVDNLNRWLEYRKLKILNEGDHKKTVLPQMKKLHRSEQGKIVKKDDHGPDALMCAVLPFDFIERMAHLFKGGVREMIESGDDYAAEVTTI